jgi:Zn-dependent oligopeptidase
MLLRHLHNAGGLYDKTIADKLYRNVFSVGASIDESAGYRNFRDHDPDVKALMRSRGLSGEISPEKLDYHNYFDGLPYD